MGRAKLRMELIPNDKNRKATYENRKHGMIKKAKELSVLCDVNTAIIVYPPDSDRPEIWPENPDQIKKTIGAYKEKKNENRKRRYDLGDYFQTRKRKVEEELVRARERNMEAKYPTWFDELNGLSEGQLRQFAVALENKEKIVRDHLERKKRNLINLKKPFGFEFENIQPCSNYVGSYPSVDRVQALNHDLISHEIGDAPNVQMAFGFGIENNQPVNPNVCFDEVEAMEDELMSDILEWFDDPQNVRIACGFELENDKPVDDCVGSYPNVDQVQVVKHDLMSQDHGWSDDAPTTWFSPPKPEMGGFGSPVYDNSNPWVSAGGAMRSDDKELFTCDL